MQTRCTISTDVRNAAEANLQIKCSNLQLRSRAESCKEVQNKIIKSKSNPNPIERNLWNPIPSLSWISAVFKSKSMFISASEAYWNKRLILQGTQSRNANFTRSTEQKWCIIFSLQRSGKHFRGFTKKQICKTTLFKFTLLNQHKS